MRDTRSLVRFLVMVAAAIAFFFGSALLAQNEPDTTAEPIYEMGSGITSPKSVYAPTPMTSSWPPRLWNAVARWRHSTRGILLKCEG